MTTKHPNDTAPSPSLAGWQARTIHTITLPSGQTVRMRLPGVATILEYGDLPDDLIGMAVAEITRDGGAAVLVTEAAPDREATLTRLREFTGFQRHLVAAALVEPALTYEQITEAVQDGSLPEDDLAMVAEIVQRLRNRDARGVMVGVEPLDRWATFREAHGCSDPGCEACQKVVEQFSSVDAGAL